MKTPLFDTELAAKITRAGQEILRKIDEEASAEGRPTTGDLFKTKRYDRLRVGEVDYIPYDEAVRQVMAVQAREQQLIKAVRDTLTWAEQRCPCNDDQPKICPLCGADAAKDACMSAENTIPRHILTQLRQCLPVSPLSLGSPPNEP